MVDMNRIFITAQDTIRAGAMKVTVELKDGVRMTMQKDPFPRVKGDMPETTKIQLKKDDRWVPFELWQEEIRTTSKPYDTRVHAVEYSNGRIWDAVNGWRPM